ncbi:hypothetical protein ILUMI_09202 [Ignelater luminosus]|uniref:Cytochrome P450 n=1 Tax=Ignelater luminosus TaxID=2038154 RepID=A0A8K0D5H4_IGNLU|nr:hypothetical protein ILUMI_09202 [Ignelater luminosus]
MEKTENIKFIITFSGNVFNILLLISVFTLIMWYAQYHWKRRNLYAKASQINGPLPLPLVGNALMFAGSNSEIIDTIMKLTTTYKSPTRIWLGPKLYIAAWKPDQLEIILNQTLEKDELYKQTEIVVGKGLFTASVPKWRRHKKLILPAFNQKILNRFVDVFYEKSEVLVEQLNTVAGKGTFDIFTYVGRCVLDIFCETTLGVTVNAQTTGSDYFKWLEKGMEIVFTKMAVVWYHYDFIFNRTLLGKEFYEAINKVLNFHISIIKKRTLTYQQTMRKNKEKPEALVEEEQGKILLDHLIELSKKADVDFTEEELREEINTFIIGASETTSVVESFFFIMLGMFPDIQDRVYEEVINVLGPDRPVECKDLKDFVYLERVIKETLRVLPTNTLMARAVTKDIKLDNCTLPAGSSVIIATIVLHRDAEVWPDPLRFDPDRFLPEEIIKRHPYSWLPFSGGPRYCVGTKYAMMSMKTLLATVVRKCRFSTPYKSIADIKIKNDLMLKPLHGFKVSVELRK